MRLRLPVAAVAVALAVVLLGPVSGAGTFDGGSGTTDCVASDGSVVGTVTWSPAKLWPPNHKMRNASATFTEADADGDTVTLTIDGITNTEEGFEKGSTARHGPDSTGVGTTGTGTGSASTPFTLRSERMGTSRDGRTYTITVTCTDTGDASLEAPQSGTATLTVLVPHDRRHA
jgi:hypothetical protein